MEFVSTALGRVAVWGNWATNRPLVLGIRGAFAEADDLVELDPPGCDLALLHLPGFHSPHLVTTSVGAFIAAFDEVIGKLWSGRQITVVGLSVGAIVALGLRSREVRAVLAVEPFFSTAKLWPMIYFIRHMNEHDEALLRWTKAVFGVDRQSVSERDYSAVLQRTDRPVHALFGDIALDPPRDVAGLPSLADSDDRRRLPHTIVQGGHAIPTSDIRIALIALRDSDQHDKNTPCPPGTGKGCVSSA